MNTENARFDLLVDDELSGEDRRELLSRLDDEPNGWRQCALAFLEAQCWKQSLGEISASGSAGVSPANQAAASASERVSPAPRRTRWPSRFALVSAMAASFLVALFVGDALHRQWNNLPVPTNQVAQNTTVTPSAAPKQPAAADAVKMVTVSSPSDGRPLANVPAVERDRLDEQWLKNVPPAIPENVLRALARTGHQVQQQRELMPVSLNDGRQMIVPVDRVNVHYIGNGPF